PSPAPPHPPSPSRIPVVPGPWRSASWKSLRRLVATPPDMEYVNRLPQANENVMDYSLLGGEHVQRGRRLFTTGSVLLAGSALYLAYHANVATELHLFQGLLIYVLAGLPSLLWAK